MAQREEVPFAVALRRRVGQQTGNAGRDHREDEIALDVNVRFTTVPITATRTDASSTPETTSLASLRLVEDEHSQHWGGHARMMVENLMVACAPRHFCGKRVVELGAGTGLVGLALAAAGADVVLTDQAAGLPILERNASLNADALRAASCQPATVHKLTWGGVVEDLRPPVDAVVCSDCIYMATSIDPLIDTMRLLSDTRTEIWVAHQHRNPEVERLFRERAVARGLSIVKEAEVQDRERYGDVRFTVILLKQTE